MNLKEIRIGNWLSTIDNSWGTVKSIGNTTVLDHSLLSRGYSLEELFPIEMTREFLSLCDFQIHNAFYLHKNGRLYIKYLGTGDLILDDGNTSTEFAFVHQLQNLFFDITGELLEPNLYGN